MTQRLCSTMHNEKRTGNCQKKGVQKYKKTVPQLQTLENSNVASALLIQRDIGMSLERDIAMSLDHLWVEAIYTTVFSTNLNLNQSKIHQQTLDTAATSSPTHALQRRLDVQGPVAIFFLSASSGRHAASAAARKPSVRKNASCDAPVQKSKQICKS